MKKLLLTVTICVFLSGLTAPGFAAYIVHTPTTSTQPKTEEPAGVSSALREFINLSRKEKRERIKMVKSQLKEFKHEKRDGNESSTNQVLLVILAILLPPLAVYLHEGVINGKFWLDLILTLLFFLPGVIYALIVVLKKN
ncbi:MAG: YqaE/Pmp3 family membrane protein [Ginsengibacter sp.]